MGDPAQRALTLLSADSLASRPVWTPDGRRVAYVQQTGSRVTLRIVNADGSASAESLLAWPDLSLWEVLFTPDGHSLVLRTTGGVGSRNLWWAALDSAQRRSALLASPADEVSAALSPDGRWMAYASNESGRYEIYVRSFSSMGARHPVSLDGGTEPVWSPRGGELFDRSGPTMMAAEVRATTTFEVVRRGPLFTNAEYESDPTHAGYDVAPGTAGTSSWCGVSGAPAY
jgi:serine/threonine-protein kinase